MKKGSEFSLAEKLDILLEVNAHQGWVTKYGSNVWGTIQRGFLAKHPERAQVSENAIRQCTKRMVKAWNVGHLLFIYP